MSRTPHRAGVEIYRKRSVKVEMMLWDGWPECAERIRTWVGLAPDSSLGFVAGYEPTPEATP